LVTFEQQQTASLLLREEKRREEKRREEKRREVPVRMSEAQQVISCGIKAAPADIAQAIERNRAKGFLFSTIEFLSSAHLIFRENSQLSVGSKLVQV